VAEIYFRGFLVSLTNPKTLLFYAAFLPQFVISTVSPINQLIVLAVTFLMIAASLDSLWALLAGRLRPLLGTKAVIRNRLTGGLLIVAGLGLALARRS
jgi:threonine/homoserine/homoserine lactone efflux protein